MTQVSKLKCEVELIVSDHPDQGAGATILETRTLRVDFDIRNIGGFSRGVVTVYNLNDATVKALSSKELYLTLSVTLSSGAKHNLTNSWIINNMVDELKLPNRVVNLYIFDRLKREVLEKSVNVTVFRPSLRKSMRAIVNESGPNGKDVPISFVSFPSGLIDETGYVIARPWKGNVMTCIRRMQIEYGFSTFTDGGGFYFLYRPSASNVGSTSLATDSNQITLTTESMRSNPKIGVGSATITANLNPDIRPTTVLDLSKLLTIGADAPQASKELVEGYLKNFGRYNKYQAFSVQHQGSNYTDLWQTVVNCYTPIKGKLFPTVGWAQPY